MRILESPSRGVRPGRSALLLALAVVAAVLPLGPLDPAVAAPVSVVEAVVVSGADDVEELASGALYVGSSDLELGENDGPQAVGLRFASV
ncbi:MAG: hypothetical protein R3290_08910, partial [Acidimicrobiia bacterium]|nr:hypothetical protein [Acidimicrobiia bacterium]